MHYIFFFDPDLESFNQFIRKEFWLKMPNLESSSHKVGRRLEKMLEKTDAIYEKFKF